jgi:hypothetical protein
MSAIGIIVFTMPVPVSALTATWTQTFTTTGSNSWTAPAEVTAVTAECWGAGGAGGGGNTAGSGAGAGGGGGAYAKTNSVAVTAGNSYTFSVGAGGTGGTGAGPIGATTTFTGDSAQSCVAQGGRGGGAGGAATGGAGGQIGAGQSTGDVKFAGGTGSTTLTTHTLGGGGGSSGGTASTGNSATSRIGATAVSGGGSGGDGGTAGGNGSAPSGTNATNPSGGGGGGGQRSGGAESGGNGQNGRGRLTYDVNITRLYLNNTAAPITPTVKGTWTSSANASSTLMDTSKSGSIQNSQLVVSSSVGQKFMHLQAVSKPLSAAVTLSNVLNLVVAAGSSQASSCSYAAHVYVTQGDSTTLVRGTLLSNHAEGIASPWTGGSLPSPGIAGRNFSASTSVSTVNAQAGDRIVVEIGCEVVGGTGPTAAIAYGGTGSDLNRGGAYNSGVGYIEFAHAMTFGDPPDLTPRRSLLLNGRLKISEGTRLIIHQQ